MTADDSALLEVIVLEFNSLCPSWAEQVPKQGRLLQITNRRDCTVALNTDANEAPS